MFAEIKIKGKTLKLNTSWMLALKYKKRFGKCMFSNFEGEAPDLTKIMELIIFAYEFQMELDKKPFDESFFYEISPSALTTQEGLKSVELFLKELLGEAPKTPLDSPSSKK